MLHSQKFCLNLLLLFLAASTFSQNQINGKILDAETNLPIPNVEIIENTSSKVSFSDSFGNFKLTNPGNFVFSKKGYIDFELNISTDKFTVIQLYPLPSQLMEVVVNANVLPRNLLKEVSSVGIVSPDDIDLSNNTDFAPILNRVPGVFMQSGALNTNRITIRGIGSRNLFGTSKIRAYFKDIPLTNGSGETTIEDFELASIASMEIIKGATSSSYGAGLGGTIILKPKNSYSNTSTALTEFQVGSFGLLKNIANLNLGLDNNSFRAVYSNTQSDGYRDNNNYDRQTITLLSNHYLNKNNDISIFGSYIDLKAFIPSSLNESDFRNNPKMAAFTWGAAKGFEDSQRGILGLTWDHSFTNNLKQVTSIFTAFRENFEPRPFNILEDQSFAYGLRSRLIGNILLLEKQLNYTVGGEFFRDAYANRTFQNLYGDFPEGNGSVQGGLLSDFKENRTYYNIFIEADFNLLEKTTLSAGLNLNQTSYKLEDKYVVSEDNPDQSGDFDFDAILSPKLGLSYQLSEDISLFTNLSHGFSPISLNETLLPDGQINNDLNPETGWNFEIGSRGQVFENRLQYAISIYRLDIKNLVVSRRTAQDQFIGVNAGETRHDGLELNFDYKLFKSDKFQLNPFLSYTLNNFKFEEFVDSTGDYSGNNLTGVPDQVLNLGVSFNSDFGVYGNINYQYVGQIPINDSNELYINDYRLSNLKVGFKKQLIGALRLDTFFGLNNIFNVDYASQVLINATGFGGAAPRYYYPGNPINYFSGIRLNYEF